MTDFKVSVYCGSYNPCAFATYDERKYPNPPYKKLQVKSITSSNPDFKCTKVIIGGQEEHYPWNFVIGSGQGIRIEGTYSGPVSIRPTENPSALVTLSGKLL